MHVSCDGEVQPQWVNSFVQLAVVQQQGVDGKLFNDVRSRSSTTVSRGEKDMDLTRAVGSDLFCGQHIKTDVDFHSPPNTIDGVPMYVSWISPRLMAMLYNKDLLSR